jgi:hypothetical protein
VCCDDAHGGPSDSQRKLDQHCAVAALGPAAITSTAHINPVEHQQLPLEYGRESGAAGGCRTCVPLSVTHKRLCPAMAETTPSGTPCEAPKRYSGAKHQSCDRCSLHESGQPSRSNPHPRQQVAYHCAAVLTGAARQAAGRPTNRQGAGGGGGGQAGRVRVLL